MIKQIFIKKKYYFSVSFRTHWRAWLLGFDTTPPMYREDGVKHTVTEIGIYVGPWQLHVWW